MKKASRVRCIRCQRLLERKMDFRYSIGDVCKPYIIETFVRYGKRMGICYNCMIDLLDIHNKRYDDNMGVPEQEGVNSKITTQAQYRESPKNVQSQGEIINSVHVSNVEIEELTSRYDILTYRISSVIEKVKEYVVGQDEAVEALVYTIFYNKYARYLEEFRDLIKNSQLTEYGTVNEESFYPDFKKNHMLFIGPTGVGKTKLIKTTCSILGIPYSISNATEFTSEGYVGGDLVQTLERLYDASGEDLELAQNGILVIDEIDKKIMDSGSGNRDISGKSVQQELLKYMESGIVWISPKEERRIHGSRSIPFNVGSLTIIFSGAFVGLDEERAKRLNQRKIGYAEKETKFNRKESYIPDDFINYGFIPEFIGRISKVIELKKLSKQDMKNIIYQSRDSIFLQKRFIFASKGIDLEISECIIDIIAEKASNSSANARTLEQAFNDLLDPALRQIFEHPPGGICEIDKHGQMTIIFNNEEGEVETYEKTLEIVVPN